MTTQADANAPSSGKLPDLESMFFDAEVAMEGEVVCRDLACTIAQEEIYYLQDIAELLLFLLLPKVNLLFSQA